ncbi:thiamine-binding protein [Tsukamurella sp. PLM1]|uniref:thiamine-binding protein n=1 Tax=Tsukamurella sp. PLM1 TaxID=2929795 RepID=UPI0020BD9574|nr:thiamine-binding protein [Tsukamurella sp. PLM1]
MRLTAEFTSEPFEGEGDVPRHADRAVGVLRAAGLDHDFGPLGTSVEGDRDSVLDALRDALDAAFSSGATRVTVQIERTDD